MELRTYPDWWCYPCADQYFSKATLNPAVTHTGADLRIDNCGFPVCYAHLIIASCLMASIANNKRGGLF